MINIVQRKATAGAVNLTSDFDDIAINGMKNLSATLKALIFGFHEEKTSGTAVLQGLLVSIDSNAHKISVSSGVAVTKVGVYPFFVNATVVKELTSEEKNGIGEDGKYLVLRPEVKTSDIQEKRLVKTPQGTYEEQSVYSEQALQYTIELVNTPQSNDLTFGKIDSNLNYTEDDGYPILRLFRTLDQVTGFLDTATNDKTSGSLMLRDENGRAKIANPSANDDIANKVYVDNCIDIEATARQQHEALQDNPHKVTKAQIGLGNCDNKADKDKHVASAETITTVLPPSKGGTGSTSILEAFKNLMLGGVGKRNAAIIYDDDINLIIGNDYIAETSGAWRRCYLSDIWGYFKSKIKNVLGLTETSYSGTADQANYANRFTNPSPMRITDSVGGNFGEWKQIYGSGRSYDLPLPKKAQLDIVGNVIGNCSGSSSSCTGNAATATKASSCSGNSATASRWQEARDFYIQDSSGSNKGTTTKIDGSSPVAMSLPSTIKANITGNCSGSSGSCTGNSATATKATKATQDESGNNIKTNYAASLEVSGKTVTLKSKSGATLSSITTQDTTYSVATTSALSSIGKNWNMAGTNGLMSGEDKAFIEALKKTVTIKGHSYKKSDEDSYVYYYTAKWGSGSEYRFFG